MKSTTGNPTSCSRRDVLKGAAAVAAAASVVPGNARWATAQGMPARAQVDAVLRQAVDAREVPGVVAMAATDKGMLYEGAFGFRALGEPAPMTLDTVFRIVSMTKAITWVAAMQLVEEGRFRLDAPVPDIDAGAQRAAGAGGLRRRRRAAAAAGEAADHAQASDDPYRRVQLRDVGRRTRAATARRPACPGRTTGKLAALRRPLVFDPGDRWEYGVNIDWVGPASSRGSAGSARRVFPRAHLRARSA